MALSKDEIVAAIAARAADVATYNVPEWGGDVYLRRLSTADLDAAGVLGGTDETTAAIARKVLALSLCDDKGARLFEDADIEALDKADATVTLRVFGECARINGLMSAELEEMLASFE